MHAFTTCTSYTSMPQSHCKHHHLPQHQPQRNRRKTQLKHPYKRGKKPSLRHNSISSQLNGGIAGLNSPHHHTEQFSQTKTSNSRNRAPRTDAGFGKALSNNPSSSSSEDSAVALKQSTHHTQTIRNKESHHSSA